jgi:hypothetical protein
VDTQQTAPTSLPSLPSSSARRNGALREVLVIVGGIATGGALVTAMLIFLLAPSGAASPTDQVPTPGIEASQRPIGTPQTVPDPGTGYAFIHEQADNSAPVAFDPCRTIHYVMRPDNAPADGLSVLQSALARLTEVTGLHFTYDGLTSETLTPHRPAFQPETYGDRWAPVLIQWSGKGENPDFDSTDSLVLAQTSSTAAHHGASPSVYVTGQVDLSAAWFTAFLDGRSFPDGAARAQAIIEHELGHLVGLAHVEDPTQLMDSFSDQRDYQAGDLAGLAALGSGACVPAL